jgi:hypothetical protein
VLASALAWVQVSALVPGRAQVLAWWWCVAVPTCSPEPERVPPMRVQERAQEPAVSLAQWLAESPETLRALLSSVPSTSALRCRVLRRHRRHGSR